MSARRSRAKRRKQSRKMREARRILSEQTPVLPSPQDILDARSPKAKRAGTDAWTAITLATWGVPWPPPAGWRARLEFEWRVRHSEQHRLARPATQRPGPRPQAPNRQESLRIG